MDPLRSQWTRPPLPLRPTTTANDNRSLTDRITLQSNIEIGLNIRKISLDSYQPKMPGIEKLHLEDAFDDSPQMRSLVSVFEEDANKVKKYVETFHQCCQRILDAENALISAQRSLSNHLKNYDKTKFPLEIDTESVFSSSLLQFANMLDEVSSWHQILATQLTDGMMYPLSRFIHNDLEDIATMNELFQVSSSDVDKVLTKYGKISKRKDNDRDTIDTCNEVYNCRKKFHQVALHYYDSLNSLQYKRKTALLEPLIGFLYAFKSHFTIGYDALSVSDVDDFLANMNASVQEVNSALALESKNATEKMDSIKQQSQHLYHAERMPDMPYIPPDLSMLQKASYLNSRTRVAAVVTRWDRAYFFTQGGNLMSISKGEVAGSLVMELDGSVLVHCMEHEERKFVFQVTNGKKTVVLQALNDKERDEWMATIQNIIQDGGYMKEKPKTSRSASVPVSKASASGHSLASSSRSLFSSASEEERMDPNSSLAPFKSILAATPIVFDMISPTDENKAFKGPKEGRPRRTNPFDQCSSTLAADSLRGEKSLLEVYNVRFLGSMEVPFDRGEGLVHATIRQIMAARAIHNVFKMTEMYMVVTESSLRLVDPSSQVICVEFSLQDIAFWAAHKENNRLLGFITRTQEGNSKPTFNCYVFESSSSSEEICTALHTAAKVALQRLMESQNTKPVPE